MARLLAIFLRPSSRTPVKRVQEAEAVAGQGLVGDHTKGGRRQVTLLSREAWAEACADLGMPPCELDAASRRANLLVEGVDVTALRRGTLLRIGEVELQVEGETHPCQLMDDMHLGLWDALKPRQRGGHFARILVGGPLRVGDRVEVVVREVEIARKP
jgi:MOSC domain-containing protein YiiM